MKRKKRSERSLFVGNCYYCDKPLYNTDGGWIVSHEKDLATKTNMRFCHDGREGSCFDIYGEFCRSLRIDAEFIGYSTFNNNLWKTKPPFKEIIQDFLNQKKTKNTQLNTQVNQEAKKS